MRKPVAWIFLIIGVFLSFSQPVYCQDNFIVIPPVEDLVDNNIVLMPFNFDPPAAVTYAANLLPPSTPHYYQNYIHPQNNNLPNTIYPTHTPDLYTAYGGYLGLESVNFNAAYQNSNSYGISNSEEEVEFYTIETPEVEEGNYSCDNYSTNFPLAIVSGE